MATIMKRNKNIILIYNKLFDAAPLSLLYVGSALKRAGYNVRILAGTPQSLWNSIPSLVNEKPLFFGFSTCTGKPISGCMTVSKYIKALDPTSRIIWGGIHPSLLPENCLKEDYIDYVCIGEGEETAVEFADCLYSGSDDFSGVKGIGYKKDGQIFITEPRPRQSEIDKFEIDWDLVDLNDFVAVNPYYGQRTYNYMTSRGCPFNCGFCYNFAFHKTLKVRFHSMERIISDLKYIRSKTNTNYIKFCDDHFFVKPYRAIDILQRIKEFGVFPAYLQVRPDSINEDICKKLSQIGPTRLLLGWESGNNRILKLMRKELPIERTMERIGIISRFKNIKINATALIGVPTETLEEASDTIEKAIEIADKIPSAVPSVGAYIAFPGSDLYKLAISEGFVPPKDTEGWSEVDIRDVRKMDLSWIKWDIHDKKRFLYEVLRCTQCLNHSKSTNWFKTLAKQVIYRTAKFRLRKKFFRFTHELDLAYKYGNRSC